MLVYSRTFEEHLQHLRLVFDRFREAGLKLKQKKCSFGQKNVKFLDHVISPEGVQPDSTKIEAIKEYPVPRKVKDVRAFLGLANYYRKFVKDFAKIAGPLHELTKKGLKFQWTNEYQAAFDLLKTALTQAPILAYPDFTLPFDLYDDALGMVLGQIQNGREVVIAYSGRKLLPAEKNYSVTEREALAAVAGVKYFQPYLYGHKFTIHTDHNAVRWLMNIREPTETVSRHGAPRVLLSDRGSNFLSSLFREVCFLMNTDKIFTSGYRPQTNGLVERFNGTLAQSLSMYVSSHQKDWDEQLSSVLFAYRVSPSKVTGEFPFYMLYWREPLLPMDTALLPPREMSPLVAEHRARVVEHAERVRRIAAENTQRAQ